MTRNVETFFILLHSSFVLRYLVIGEDMYKENTPNNKYGIQKELWTFENLFEDIESIEKLAGCSIDSCMGIPICTVCPWC